jgi:hypothetical protein
MTADMVIEGWSFGHTVTDHKDRFEWIVQKLVTDCMHLLDRQGILVIIETLGTNVESPAPPNETLGQFYNLLENEYQFRKSIVSTDYRFKNVEEAKRIMGFFFGEKMKEKIGQQQSSIIKEFTGIWYKHVGGIAL